MEGIIWVKFGDSGQAQPYQAGSLNLKEGDGVIVEHDRGLDYGQVVPECGRIKAEESKEPPKKIIRLKTRTLSR